jgi:hypothetical protein
MRVTLLLLVGELCTNLVPGVCEDFNTLLNGVKMGLRGGGLATPLVGVRATASGAAPRHRYIRVNL